MLLSKKVIVINGDEKEKRTKVGNLLPAPAPASLTPFPRKKEKNKKGNGRRGAGVNTKNRFRSYLIRTQKLQFSKVFLEVWATL